MANGVLALSIRTATESRSLNRCSSSCNRSPVVHAQRWAVMQATLSFRIVVEDPLAGVNYAVQRSV
jgi:hypothetical protein